MPPKLVANVAASIPPAAYANNAREQVVAIWPAVAPPVVAGVPNPPNFLAVGSSDIFTYGADTIVIGTDDRMTRRNEWPTAKFHHFAGDNLRIWNQLCNYQTRLNPVTRGLSRVPVLRTRGPMNAVRAPAFRCPTFRWIVMVNVPTFDPNANPGQGNLVQGFRGNGNELYACYIEAFRVARQGRNYEVPNAVSNSMVGIVGLIPGAGLASAPMPVIAFSFMGPSHGWDVQEAANIAMTALRDSFWRQPFGGAYYGGNSAASVTANRATFTNVSINGTFVTGIREGTHTRRNPKYRQHMQALQAAFNWQFLGGAWPVIPGVPVPPPLAAIPIVAPVLPGPIPAAPAIGVAPAAGAAPAAPAGPPLGARVHRSGRWF